MTVTPEQSRAARAFLNWSQSKLAEASGVSRETIINFERDSHTPHASNADALMKAFEAAGITFLADKGRGPGVRLLK